MFYIVLLGEGTVLSYYIYIFIYICIYIVSAIMTLLGANILRSILFSKTLSLRSTVNVNDHVVYASLCRSRTLSPRAQKMKKRGAGVQWATKIGKSPPGKFWILPQIW